MLRISIFIFTFVKVLKQPILPVFSCPPQWCVVRDCESADWAVTKINISEWLALLLSWSDDGRNGDLRIVRSI